MPQHFKASPIPGRSYKQKQSRYPNVMDLPTRCLVVGPSGSGKSVVLQSLICDAYADCFAAGIHVWSHSVNLDNKTWGPVKKHMAERGFDPEKYCHEVYRESDLEKILETQKAVIEYQKKKGHQLMFGMCCIFDDVADDVKLMRSSTQLQTLFTRGRHFFCSSYVSVQKWRLVQPVVRINATDEILMAAIRSSMDLEAWASENTALAPMEVIMDIYNRARKEPYNFIWVKKDSKDPNEIFHIGFNEGETIS